MKVCIGSIGPLWIRMSVGALVAILSMAAIAAEPVVGVYRGFLAFDLKGKEVREWMMISFQQGGTLVMGAEEGHDEPVDKTTGVVTKNDFESTNVGLWRTKSDNTVEFASQQFRAGSAFCKPVNMHDKDLLPTCSFVLTARLTPDVEVRGERCDLGGVKGGLSVLSANGKKIESNPFNLGLTLDYCLRKLTIDQMMKLAPVE